MFDLQTIGFWVAVLSFVAIVRYFDNRLGRLIDAIARIEGLLVAQRDTPP